MRRNEQGDLRTGSMVRVWSPEMGSGGPRADRGGQCGAEGIGASSLPNVTQTGMMRALTMALYVRRRCECVTTELPLVLWRK